MKLPKFLLADNSQECEELIFILHTESPKFIISFDEDDKSEVVWFDAAPESKEAIELLKEQAEIFLDKELESQDELFEEMS